MPMCMDIPKVAPRASRSGCPGVTPRSWPEPSSSMWREASASRSKTASGGAGTTRSTDTMFPSTGQSPGLDCMMPPSVKMVVAVM